MFVYPGTQSNGANPTAGSLTQNGNRSLEQLTRSLQRKLLVDTNGTQTKTNRPQPEGNAQGWLRKGEFSVGSPLGLPKPQWQELKHRPMRLSAKFHPEKLNGTPDGGLCEPKAELSRSWIVENNGTVPWPTGMRFACTGGNFYGFRDFQVAPIQPGEQIRLSILLHAPAAPGSYIAHFCLVHEGVPIGPSQRVRFVVKQQRWSARSSPNQKLQVGAHFVKDLTIMDGQMVTPGQKVEKTWLIKNTGKIPWPKGTRLVCIGGNWPVGDVSVLVEDVLPSMETPVSVTLKAPNEMGRQSARFQLQLANGRRFGHRYWVNIQVSHFPSPDQLLEMGKQFLVDQQLVALIQNEIPFIFGSLCHGRPLVRIAEDLVKRCPKLKNHPFVLFIWRFLPTIDGHVRAQIHEALHAYSQLVKENRDSTPVSAVLSKSDSALPASSPQNEPDKSTKQLKTKSGLERSASVEDSLVNRSDSQHHRGKSFSERFSLASKDEADKTFYPIGSKKGISAFNPIATTSKTFSGDTKSQSGVSMSNNKPYMTFSEGNSAASLPFQRLPPTQNAAYAFGNLNIGSVNLEGKRNAGSPVSALMEGKSRTDSNNSKLHSPSPTPSSPLNFPKAVGTPKQRSHSGISSPPLLGDPGTFDFHPQQSTQGYKLWSAPLSVWGTRPSQLNGTARSHPAHSE